MSMPEIPNIEPEISITRDDAMNLLLASTGIQELSLAHLMNAEAEKMDFALGLLDTSPGPMSIEAILEASKSTRRMMRTITRSQMLIGMNVEELIELIMAGN
ncbi:MAG: hypothetical protein ACRDDX_00925 [Cellulosilyticaceae bacterium]